MTWVSARYAGLGRLAAGGTGMDHAMFDVVVAVVVAAADHIGTYHIIPDCKAEIDARLLPVLEISDLNLEEA